MNADRNLPLLAARWLLPLLTLLGSLRAEAQDIQVTNAWVRSTLSGAAATNAYMDLRSAVDLRLVGASTPWAERVEIRTAGDTAAETERAATVVITVPANKDVRLDSSGYHLALVGIVRDIAGGEWVPITLDFRDAGNVDHPVDIRAQARGNMFPPGPPPPALQP
jgi:periplasmic copper chaperone A